MNPLTPVIDELTRQANMKFRPEDVARAHRVCNAATRGARIEVECPLPVWDSQSMGVAFRKVERRMAGGTKRKFKTTASFVLSAKELENEPQIARKARVAVEAIECEVLCQIREVKERQTVVHVEPVTPMPRNDADSPRPFPSQDRA